MKFDQVAERVAMVMTMPVTDVLSKGKCRKFSAARSLLSK